MGEITNISLGSEKLIQFATKKILSASALNSLSLGLTVPKLVERV